MEQDHDTAAAPPDRDRQSSSAAALASTARREPLAHLARIAISVRTAAACERCTIQLVEGGELVVTVSDPPLLLGPRARRRPIDAGVAGRVATTRTPLYLAELSSVGGEPTAEGLTAQARTYYGVPLLRDGELLGVLQADASRGDAFDAETRRRIDGIAGELVAELSTGESPRDDASAIIGHEIRRPLTSLRGMSATLAEQADRLDRGTVRTIARRIHAASLRLERLVQDLLDLARTGEMRLEVAPRVVEVEPLLLDVASDRTDRAVTVSIEPDPSPVHTDPARLRQILENLLANAQRFSPAGSPIEVRAAREGSVVTVSVTDRGIGIPEREIEKIFHRFYQVEPDPSRGGLGIGLALVREIARALGIGVHVESRVGEGSTFTLRIPIAR